MVLAGLVVAVVLAAAGSMTLAAPAWKTDGKKTSPRQLTYFDPFSLRTIMLANGPGRDAAEELVALVSRREIRAPHRPPLRSAFRPIW
jgi:hypothetical protein